MIEKEEKDIKSFIEYLNKDIEILNESLQKIGMIPSYKKKGFHISYELFEELVKKYCYKDNIKPKKVPVSVISKEPELLEIKSIEVPEDRLTLMEKIFFSEFTEQRIISIYSINSEDHFKNKEQYFYKFLYSLYFGQFKNPEKNINIIFKELLTQWRMALDDSKMPVIIKLPIVGIRKANNNENFVNIFEVEEIFPQILSTTLDGLARSFTPKPLTYISLKTELSIDIHQSEAFTYMSKENFEKYQKEYKTKINDLFLFACALYLQGVEFKWQNPILVLPWWFEPKKIHENMQNHNIYDYKVIKKEIFNQAINSYLKIKQCELYKHNEILLNSYFRFFQHDVINTYFLIDAFTFFEGMFTKGSKDYIKLRLRLNSSALFAQSISEFWELADFFSILYDIRSVAVHGEDWKTMLENYILEDQDNINNKIFTEKIIGFRLKLILYMNKSLFDLIEKIINHPEILIDIKNDPLYYFNKSNLINKDNNRPLILDEIKNRYKTQKIKYSNKWQEFKTIFNL